MPIAKIQLPDGRIAKFEVPEGTTQEQVMQFVSSQDFSAPEPQPEVPQERSVMGAIGEAIPNIIPSGIELGKGIYHAVANPGQSLDAINKLAGGYLQKGVDQFDLERFGITAAPEDSRQYADLMNQYMGDRYGGGQEILNTLANDPAGLALDASALLSGGGTLAAKLPGVAGKAGELASKAGTMVDPIQNLIRAGKAGVGVAQGAGKLGRNILGTTTGGGTTSIERAVSGGKEFAKAFKGEIGQSDIVNATEKVLMEYKHNRSTNYTEALDDITSSVAIAEDGTPIFSTIDISPLKSSFDESLAKFNVSRTPEGKLDFGRSHLAGDESAIKAMEFANERIGSWGTKPGDLTPKGVDILKRSFDSYFSETNNARAVIADARNQTRQLLIDNVEGYEKMTAEYQKATEFINELEQTFSMGGTADTKLRKLTQAVSDNFEYRGDLLKAIDKEMGTSLVDMIAGNKMQPWLARNMVGRFAGMAAGGFILTGGEIAPSVLMALFTASPKSVAATLKTLGVPKRAIKNFIKEQPQLLKQFQSIKNAAGSGSGMAQTAAKAAVVPTRVNQGTGEYDNLIQQGVQ